MPCLDSIMDKVATEILSRWIAPKSPNVLPWNEIEVNAWVKEGIIRCKSKLRIFHTHTHIYNACIQTHSHTYILNSKIVMCVIIYCTFVYSLFYSQKWGTCWGSSSTISRCRHHQQQQLQQRSSHNSHYTRLSFGQFVWHFGPCTSTHQRTQTLQYRAICMSWPARLELSCTTHNAYTVISYKSFVVMHVYKL